MQITDARDAIWPRLPLGQDFLWGPPLACLLLVYYLINDIFAEPSSRFLFKGASAALFVPASVATVEG